ncbi:MAG: carbamoyltransferase HypF [Chloroflexota bacterium]
MVNERDERCLHIRVLGVVQGVGFRPFVFRLARSAGLAGRVWNTSEGVEITVQGPSSALQSFVDSLHSEAPPLARIHNIITSCCAPANITGFKIQESDYDPKKGQLVSPDVATCPDCLVELFNPADRRYRYPFTNCTNCGPRFTIITDMPYDRPFTTMHTFSMCPECRAEYENPSDRRFHAQPNACPVCGPRLTLLDANGTPLKTADPLGGAVDALHDGSIVAIKGLGGFLLACDATSDAAVRRLRERKRRPDKPFAVMVRDLAEARAHCVLGDEEQELLASSAAPIVLMPWRTTSSLSFEIAPGLLFLGLMLPYTPLHHLLLRDFGGPLIMTSGNLSEEPIAATNEEAVERLADIADLFLVHNRPIHSRYDDSVVMSAGNTRQVLRRARGYAPYPIQLTYDGPMVLAAGPQTKNTFCLTRDRHAFVSQHIGDLDSVETLDHFRSTIALYKRLFRVEPSVVAHDLHPDYLSTHFAKELESTGMPSVPVQHHHAHVAACMAENGTTEPVIGVVFDGAGLGTDGSIWGGEFLVCKTDSFLRAAHLHNLPLAGGDAATLRPGRTAAGYLLHLFGKQALGQAPALGSGISPEEIAIITRQVRTRLNAPQTSSMGRLFDAVSALAGIRQRISYEGQAAVELEMQAHLAQVAHKSEAYRFDVRTGDDCYVIDPSPVLESVLRDVAYGRPTPLIARAFHDAVAVMTVDICLRISRDTGIRDVVLSGGVFQNRLLLETCRRLLMDQGLNVMLHTELPANDGCISLGQAVVAAHTVRT